MIDIGERFTVTTVQEAKDAKGRLLGRYLPGFEYLVTSHSVQIVRDIEAAGNLQTVRKTAKNLALTSPPAKVSGNVKTKGKV